MDITEVIVYQDGRPSKGRYVKLEFPGVFSGGFTRAFLTDSDGVARVEHSHHGKVYVYVDGNHSSHGTTDYAPGRIIVQLKS